MALVTVEELKEKFENGKIPEQQDYEDLIDTLNSGAAASVAHGYGEMNPNGTVDRNTRERIFPPEVKALIDDNPESLLFWTDTTPGVLEGEDGEIINDENKTYFYVKNTEDSSALGFWFPVIAPQIEEFVKLVRPAELVGNYDANTNTINSYHSGLLRDNLLIYEGSTDLTISLADGGSTRLDGQVPYYKNTIVNAGTGKIIFLSPQNPNGIQVPENRLSEISTKGVVTIYNKFEGLNTLQWILTGDLDKDGTTTGYTGSFTVNGGATEIFVEEGLITDVQQSS